MDRDRFEALIEEALADLPPPFAARLENIGVEVRARPSLRTLREMGLGREDTLLGLYQGVPHPERTHDYGNVMPDRIIIYREPILDEAEMVVEEEGGDYEDAICRVVRETVLHEIGHHFGLSDDDLERLEYD